MNASTLETARNELQSQRIALRGTSDTLVSLHERTNARVTEIDEHVRRLADTIRHTRALSDETRQGDAALIQCRNDIKAGLGPQFARDIWRELVDALDSLDDSMGYEEVDAYIAISSWLFDRPKLGEFTPIKSTNIVLALKTTVTVLGIWPELQAQLNVKDVETVPDDRLPSGEVEKEEVAEPSFVGGGI